MGFYYSSTQNVNTGKAWSQMDLDDIRDFAPDMTIAQLAVYLCRSDEEVTTKAQELGLTVKASQQPG